MTPCKIIVVKVASSHVNVIADDVLTLKAFNDKQTIVTLTSGEQILAEGTVMDLFVQLVADEK